MAATAPGSTFRTGHEALGASVGETDPDVDVDDLLLAPPEEFVKPDVVLVTVSCGSPVDGCGTGTVLGAAIGAPRTDCGDKIDGMFVGRFDDADVVDFDESAVPVVTG